MSKQLLKPSIAQAREMEMMPSVLLKQTKDANQAVKFMVNISGATHESLGMGVGKPRETITRYANGNGGLNANELDALINECGNVFILQFLADKYGFELIRKDIKAQRKAELLAELEALENAA
jgi:hypothetical protein